MVLEEEGAGHFVIERDANPGLYLTAALAITFPFNITLGIPLYHEMARALFP